MIREVDKVRDVGRRARNNISGSYYIVNFASLISISNKLSFCLVDVKSPDIVKC